MRDAIFVFLNRLPLLALIALLLFLQYQLWLGQGGISDAVHLSQDLKAQAQTDEKLLHRNQIISAEIKDLKQGQEASEERARFQLGLIKKDETYFQMLPAVKKQ